jgi:hypothetical protein
MTTESQTYEQLMIGDLLKRQKDLHNLMDAGAGFSEFHLLMIESIEIHGKLIEFYKNTDHNL